MAKHLFVFLCFIGSAVYCQDCSISGFVYADGETLPFASVTFGNKHHALTNAYGYFSFQKIQCEKDTLTITSIGYKRFQEVVNPQISVAAKYILIPQENSLEEVVIRGQKNPTFRTIIDINQVRKTTAMLGEADALKVIQLLPGVQGGNEGTAGIYVRGGGEDQTSITLDHVPVYNVNHLFGFLSVFNTDALSGAELYKGYMPGSESSRSGSALSVQMKEGNKLDAKQSFTLNPLISKVLIEGPLGKKSSYLFTARRSWIDMLYAKKRTNLLPAYHFLDVNAKVNYELNKSSKLFLSLYTGEDTFSIHIRDEDNRYGYEMDWGNTTLSARYIKWFESGEFLQIIPYFTKFHFNTELNISTPPSEFTNLSGSQIQDKGVRVLLDLRNNSFFDETGITFIAHRFSPEIKVIQGTDIAESSEHLIYNNQEWNAYTDFSIAENDILNFRGTLNLRVLQHQQSTIVRLEPKLLIEKKWLPTLSSHLSFVRASQFIHLLFNPALSLPSSIWVPATAMAPPPVSNNLSMGLSKTWADGKWLTSIDAYLHDMHHVLDFKNLTDFLNNTSLTWEENVVSGIGQSKGLEFLIKKERGKINGWVSYTLSKSTRQFAEINDGKTFKFQFNRPHNLHAVFNYAKSERNQFSINYTLSSGSYLTYPTANYRGLPPYPGNSSAEGVKQPQEYFNQLHYVPSKNNFQLPLYHRADFSYKNTKVKKYGSRTLGVDVYNVYNQKNAFLVFNSGSAFKKFTLFPLLPSFSISYAFK